MRLSWLGKTTLATLTFVIGVGVLSAESAQKRRFISIGTGGVTGVYYPTGGAICRLLNKDRKRHGIRCSVESTGGSIYNLNTMRAGDLDFGVVQSDWQYHAYYGTSKFKDKGPYKDLRAVFSVHSEPVTILARRDSGIKHLKDVKGRRFNIGNPGSGTRGTWEVLEKALGWKRGDLKLASELKSAEMSQALCDNKIDSYFWLVGHPSASTKEAVASCNAVIVDVSGPVIDRLIKEKPYYRYATIPGGMYKGNPEDIKTFGVGATFVTRADVPEDVVYELVMAVFKNMDTFRKLHPAFKNLEPAEMAMAGLSAPLHPGAARAYKEIGIVHKRTSILWSFFEFLPSTGAEEKDYGLYSYLLFPQKSANIQHFLEELFRQTSHVGDSGIDSSKEINLIYIPIKDHDSLLQVEKQYHAKKIADEFYNFHLSRKILSVICAVPAPSLQDTCSKAWGDGPYLFTYTRPASSMSNPPPPYLFVNLSGVPTDAYPELIAAYREQVKRSKYTDRKRIDTYRLEVLKALLTAAKLAGPVLIEIRKAVHMIRSSED